MQYRTSFLAMLFCILSTLVMAQTNTNSPLGNENKIKKDSSMLLSLISKYDGNTIKLRWAPLHPQYWEAGNKNGYRLERAVYIPGTQPPVEWDFKPIAGIIKPWPLLQWKSFLEKGDTISLIAAQGIYGNNEVDYKTEGIVAASEAIQNVFGFSLLAADLSIDCAEASGLFFEDRNVEKDRMYIYRLTMAEIIPNINQDTASSLVFTDLIDTLSPPINLSSISNEKRINLKWNNQNKNRFTAYNIERSTDGLNFEKINKKPYVEMKSKLTKDNIHISYSDNLKENYKPYYYRIRGIDAFGEESTPTQTIKAMGVDATPPTEPTNIKAKVIEKNKVEISWDYNPEEFEPDFNGFVVLHSFHPTEGFEPISAAPLAPIVTSFTHTKPSGIAENYYKVASIDTTGNRGNSIVVHAMIIDETPPSAPTGLTGEIDSTGIVSIYWDLGPEEDIYAYNVYFANQEDHIFSKRSNQHLKNTSFFDSIQIKTLTEDIFYYVVALDASFNESERSEILKLNKPDFIPPAAPLFTKYKVSSDAIEIFWLLSSSKDVVNYNLMRKRNNENWVTIKEFKNSESSFYDTDVIEGNYYSYKIIAIDDAHLLTECPDFLMLQANGPFFIPSPTDIKATKNENDITISWNYMDVKNVYFMVYRQINDGKVMSFKRYDLKAGETSFEVHDKFINNKKLYKYSVKAIRNDGKESALNNFVKPE